MKKIFTLIIFVLFTSHLIAQISYIKGDSLNRSFGSSVAVLQNGNYVVTDPNWKNENNLENVGAVYLYNGATHQLISRLTGSHANDRIGSNGIKALPNGNFVVLSPKWKNDFGALTLVNGVTGLSAEINISNSIIGQDHNEGLPLTGVGNGELTILPNGNLIYKGWGSPYPNDLVTGYLFWIDANKATQGKIENHINHGEIAYLDERIGYVRVLSNGNYMTISAGLNYFRGRITWWDSSTGKALNGISGSETFDIAYTQIIELSTQNFLLYKLTGGQGHITWLDKSISYDRNWTSANGSNRLTITGDVYGVQELPNGNVVIRNAGWDNGKGAITVVNGSTGFTANDGFSGTINSTNSLVGSNDGDYIGNGNIHVLKNGNFVIQSPDWGGVNKYGAVTFINKDTRITGVLSDTNSLVGTRKDENVGSGNIIELPNGNFLIQNPAWDNNTGAVTWVDGNTGIKGHIEDYKTLSGDARQSIGRKIVVLSNSNYIVFSPSWYESLMSPSVGAVTWCNGTTGMQGIVTRHNSLIGSQSSDISLSGNAIELSNGNYVIINNSWGGGKGAVTWASGSQATIGEISSANSLIGTLDSDRIGAYGITPLKSGNYIINSTDWNNKAGAITWANGTLPVTGEINISNSLIGNNPNDKIGNNGITTFASGLYAIKSTDWNNQGAITWANENTGITGNISETNSLLGANLNERIAYSTIKAHANGNLILINSGWNNRKGAITWINSSTGKTGFLSSSNALVGTNDNDLVGNSIDSLFSGNLVVRSYYWGKNKGAITWIGADTELKGTLNSSNSLTGTTDEDQIGTNPVLSLSDSYVIRSSYFNQRKGAITWVKDKKALSGEITSCNSLLGNVTLNFLQEMKPHFNKTYNYLLTSTDNSGNNFYGIQFLNGDTTSQYFVTTANIQNKPEEFSNRCETIASLAPSGTNPVNGIVTAKMWKNTPDLPKEFVNRHFELNPANNPNSTGTVTLYFTQEDFDIYNNKNSTKLPTSPTDELNKQKLVVEKYSGTSNDNTGLPNTYQSQAVNIVIHPDSVKWLANEQKWAVSFDVKDFSGFFLKSRVDQLPLKWLNVYAKKQSSQTAAISWNVQESDVDNYVIEKSVDGIYFTSIGNLKSVGNGTNQYTAYDNQFTAAKSYYRILQVDKNGKNSYSNIVSLNQDNNKLVSIYPNPAANYIVINTPEDFIGQTAVITDVNGRAIQSFKITATAQTVNLSNIQNGLYLVKFNNSNIIKFIKH